MIALLFFLSLGGLEVNITSTVSQFGNKSMDYPVGVTRTNGHIYFLDESMNIWKISEAGEIVAVFGGEGQGPDQLTKDVTYFGADDDSIIILHSTGMKKSRFGLDGEAIEQKSIRSGFLYHDDANSVWTFAAASIQDKYHETVIAWKRHDKMMPIVDILKRDDEDTVLGWLAAKIDDKLLVINQHTITATLRFGVLDLKDGDYLDLGTRKTADPYRLSDDALALMRSGEGSASARVVEGVTTYGNKFVITERPSAGKYRFLSILDVDGKWLTVKFNQGDLDLIHLTYLGNEKWMGFDLDEYECVFFEITGLKLD